MAQDSTMDGGVALAVKAEALARELRLGQLAAAREQASSTSSM
jgi:hypothetical protein